ncbi:MAG: hypothetical protein QOG80_2322, partial [Pseudonocardiales bacterium]|nr:hypothetical protein [Pseudonocardiales bacterium]
MAGQHRARSLLRTGTALLAAGVAAAGMMVAISSTANAATAASACDAQAAAGNGPTPIHVAQANPASSPCVFDSVALADANITVIPGIPGITGVNAQVHAVKSTTSYALFGGFASAEAQTDVARLSVIAPGLILSATGVHSQAGVSINPFCGGAALGESWIGSLTVNGHAYQIGNKPFTINLGLRITLSL